MSRMTPDRRMTEAEAGARFDACMAIFRNGWAEAYPDMPFEVDGVVTPQAMEYIRGYRDGLRAWEDSDEPADSSP